MVPRLLKVLGGTSVRKLALLVGLVVSSAAFAATPPAGVPLEVRRGFFTETGLGGAFTVGGYNGYSNFQLYLQLGAGYQLTINDNKGLIPIGLHVGFGSNAQNCWGDVNTNETCAQADNFTMTFINATAGYLHRFGDGYITSRLYGGGKIVGGVSLLDPAPIANGGLVYPNAGIVGALEFASMVDHFSAGLDIGYRLIIGPNINALSFAVRVQYTF